MLLQGDRFPINLNHYPEPTLPEADSRKLKIIEHAPKPPPKRILPPRAISGLSVFLQLEDKNALEIAKRNFKVLDINPANDSLLADLIISDTPVTISLPMSNSRGAQLLRAGANLQHSKPKVIPPRFVPWLFRPIPQKPKASFTEVEPSTFVNRMIIFDTTRKHQPKICPKTFDKISFYTDPVPKNYSLCPLVPVPKDPVKLADVMHKSLQPHLEIYTLSDIDNGYCEYCNKNYCSAKEHHNSRQHRQKVEKTNFSNFDRLAAKITERNFVFSEPSSEL